MTPKLKATLDQDKRSRPQDRSTQFYLAPCRGFLFPECNACPCGLVQLELQYRKMLTSTTQGGATSAISRARLSHLRQRSRRPARSDGYDILFTSSDGTTKLDHEIEEYTSARRAGRLGPDPSLSNSADTDIYMYYGYSRRPTSRT